MCENLCPFAEKPRPLGFSAALGLAHTKTRHVEPRSDLKVRLCVDFLGSESFFELCLILSGQRGLQDLDIIGL